MTENGKTVIVEALSAGEYNVDGASFKVKNCGMRALHFVSRKTGHPLVKDFEKNDFSFWYDEKADMMTPLVRQTFTGEGFVPILTSGNTLPEAHGASPFSLRLYAERSRSDEGS